MCRVFCTIISGLVLAAALGTAVTAAPIFRDGDIAAGSASLVLVDARCGKGWHYVPAGYARHAKWRAAHCSRD